MANVLTNVGKQIVTYSLKRPLPGSGVGSAEPNRVAWGSGSLANNGAGNNGVPANVVDTALATEEAEARVSGTSSIVTDTTTNDTYQVQGTITAIGNKSITNAGLFDTDKAQGAGAGGNLFAKGDFTSVALNTGDSIAFTFRWRIQ